MDPNLEFLTKKQHSIFFFLHLKRPLKHFSQPFVCCWIEQRCLVRLNSAAASPRPGPDMIQRTAAWVGGVAEGHSQGLQTDIRPKPELKSY